MENMIKVILLVDDDESLLLIEEEVLTGFGYNVICCSCGLDALKEFNSNPKIDLILTDKKMEDLSGEDLILKIREKNDLIPIILTSGSFMDYDCQKSEDIPNVYYLPKPYRINKLIHLIKGIENKTC